MIQHSTKVAAQNRLPARPGLWHAALLCLLLTNSAGAMELKCPERIRTEQRIGAIAAGWEPASIADANSLNSLSAIQFFDGPPSAAASLAPDQTLELSQKSMAIWKFAPGSANNVWFACNYFLTTMILARKLPAGIQQCKAIYRKGYADVKSVTCR